MLRKNCRFDVKHDSKYSRISFFWQMCNWTFKEHQVVVAGLLCVALIQGVIIKWEAGIHLFCEFPTDINLPLEIKQEFKKLVSFH